MGNLSYIGLHARLRTHRGPARDFACATECGRQAAEWSYDHLDPDELVEHRRGKVWPYSLDLDRYQPVCRPCHVRRDRFDGWTECLVAGCSTMAMRDCCCVHWIGPRRPRIESFPAITEHGRKRVIGSREGIVSTMTHKRCAHCREVKSVEAFSTAGRDRRGAADPYKNICLACDRVKARRRYILRNA